MRIMNMLIGYPISIAYATHMVNIQTQQELSHNTVAMPHATDDCKAISHAQLHSELSHLNSLLLHPASCAHGKTQSYASGLCTVACWARSTSNHKFTD